MQFEAEIQAEETDSVIYFDSIRHWDASYQNEVILPDEKNRIKDNGTAALKEKRLEIEWERWEKPALRSFAVSLSHCTVTGEKSPFFRTPMGKTRNRDLPFIF